MPWSNHVADQGPGSAEIKLMLKWIEGGGCTAYRTSRPSLTNEAKYRRNAKSQKVRMRRKSLQKHLSYMSHYQEEPQLPVYSLQTPQIQPPHVPSLEQIAASLIPCEFSLDSQTTSHI